MKINEVLSSDLFYITEGLTFFKNSKRLLKLAAKMESNIQFVKDAQEKREISDYIVSLKDAAKEFAEVETKYNTENKYEAKAAYDRLKVKYFNLIKDINTETMKKFLLGAGLYIGLAILMSVFPGKSVAAPGADGKVDISSIQRQIASNNAQIDSIKDETKRLSLMSRNMKLIEELQKKLASLQKKTFK